MVPPMDESSISNMVRAALEAGRARTAGANDAADGTSLTANEFDAIVGHVAELSERLNLDRAIVRERYLDVPELLAGYVAFFLPRSIHQVASVLGELDRPPKRLVDIGCGPGAATLAACQRGVRAVLALDHAPAALEFVGRVTDDRVTTRQLDFETGDAAAIVRDFEADTAVASHVVNELFSDQTDAHDRRADFCMELLDALLDDGRLILIDPALRSTSRDLLHVRNALVERGAAVIAPCLRQSTCPALEDPRDWCHAERPWSPAPIVKAIAEAVGVRHDVAKMTYLVIGKNAPTFAENQYRIVSEPLHTKGRLRYFGCGRVGRHAIVMKERDATGAAAAFASLDRGDVISIGETVPKGDGDMIRRGEPVQVLARAGEPFPDRDN
jgi:SAM-dependent methyltransferase